MYAMVRQSASLPTHTAGDSTRAAELLVAPEHSHALTMWWHQSAGFAPHSKTVSCLLWRMSPTT